MQPGSNPTNSETVLRVPITTNPHLKQLDVLRGIAITTVFLFHFYGLCFAQDSLQWKGMWRDLSSAPSYQFLMLYPLAFGWLGVSLFFVISGFVIHLSFLKSKSFSLTGFVSRRFWRIYPPYLLALVFFSCTNHYRPRIGDFLAHVVLLNNFREAWFFGIVPAFWSIALEVQFYAIYPIALIIRKKVGINALLLSSLVLSIAVRTLIIVFADWTQKTQLSVIYALPCLWFDWLLGAYVAEKWNSGERPFPKSRWLVPTLLLALFTVYCNKITFQFSFPLASMISAILIYEYVSLPRNLTKAEQAFVPIGLCSYSFYLWHQPFLQLMLTFLHKRGIRSVAADFSISILLIFLTILAISWLLYAIVEKGSLTAGKSTARAVSAWWLSHSKF